MTSQETESIRIGGEGPTGDEADRPALPPLPRTAESVPTPAAGPAAAAAAGPTAGPAVDAPVVEGPLPAGVAGSAGPCDSAGPGGPAGSAFLAGAAGPLGPSGAGPSRAAAPAEQPWDLPPDLDHLLRPLFARTTPEGGVAVAVIRGGERAVACRGYADSSGGRPIRADTRFELGSVTTTFTGLLLAEMVARGEVRYDDPIDRYLPSGSVPGYPHERPITLIHLATHTSGLPRLPVGLVPALVPRWFTSPYATFSAAHLMRALPRTPVRGTPGTQVRYSNLGAGLLGLVLANAAGQRYEDLLANRVCGPLGLIDTSCGSGREEVVGYRRGRRVPSFRVAALPGAAALRSTADDMLRYLQAHLAVDAVPIPERTGAAATLRAALRDVCLPRVVRRRAGARVCLTWNQRQLDRDHGELVFHSGTTGGFAAFAGFNRSAEVGLVAMAVGPAATRRRFARTAYDTLRRLTA